MLKWSFIEIATYLENIFAAILIYNKGDLLGQGERLQFSSLTDSPVHSFPPYEDGVSISRVILLKADDPHVWLHSLDFHSPHWQSTGLNKNDNTIYF